MSTAQFTEKIVSFYCWMQDFLVLIKPVNHSAWSLHRTTPQVALPSAANLTSRLFIINIVHSRKKQGYVWKSSLVCHKPEKRHLIWIIHFWIGHRSDATGGSVPAESLYKWVTVRLSLLLPQKQTMTNSNWLLQQRSLPHVLLSQLIKPLLGLERCWPTDCTKERRYNDKDITQVCGNNKVWDIWRNIWIMCFSLTSYFIHVF